MLFVGLADHDPEQPIMSRLVHLGAVPDRVDPAPLWDIANPSIFLLGGPAHPNGMPWPGLQFVIAADALADADAVVGRSAAHIDGLWAERLVPFEANLRTGRRAPRRHDAALADPDPTWPRQASHLMARLRFSVGRQIMRVDHIGSTSVSGLPAKQLIDIQVVVSDLAVAGHVAASARRAGFVHVPGHWFGTDRHGIDHPEEVVVDADPGRPVNINIRPAAAPIWRETLLFRDWLQSHPDERDAYGAMKRGLAQRRDLDVDAYSQEKMPWISAALVRAEDWAATTGWLP